MNVFLNLCDGVFDFMWQRWSNWKPRTK